MRWPALLTTTLDEAVEAARRGVPTALGLEGPAGYGKSSLLKATADRLAEFHVVRAYGERTGQDERFQLLTAWGADPPPANLIQAIRQLTGLVGQWQLTGPVALLVDDLHWIDPDSVDALASLIDRAAGDRLLVIAAYRPLGQRHPRWRQLGVQTIRLGGLDPESTAALVASYGSELPPDLTARLSEQLRAHTAGSPLHIRALLQEHPTDVLVALAERGELPAPADLAAAVDTRLTSLAPDAARLLHVLAVLGDAWIDAPTAAAIAAIDDVESAIAVLVDEGLVRVDRAGIVAQVRISHAVLRAAAYQAVPVEQRRALHRAAAARLTDRGGQLRHRLMATPGVDEGLAADLERYARDRHDRAQFRDAARFARLAAQVSTTDADRERRLLDADIETLGARALDEVPVIDLDQSAGPHRRLVRALQLSNRRQWVAAADVLDTIDAADLAGLDPLNVYRTQVIRAWTILAAGRDAAAAVAPLEAAAASQVKDSQMQGLFVTTYGQVMAITSPEGPLWGFSDDARQVDRATFASTAQGLHRLSWRGSVHAVNGSTAEGIGDLGVVLGRMEDGQIERTDGVLHSFLAFAQWYSGDWRRAAITVGLAERFSRGIPHPNVEAVVPLTALVNGEDPRPGVERSRDARLAGPIPAAMYVGDVVDLAVTAFAGSDAERRGWRARRSADFGAPTPYRQGRPAMIWLLAMGFAASWAGDTSQVGAWADAIEERPGVAWQAHGVRWLRTLAEKESRAAELERLATEGFPGLKTFSAIAAVEAARNSPHSARARTEAERLFAEIGATTYLPDLLPTVQPAHDPLAQLSDREREVTTLLLDGLSYVQIAKELYVTRGTVAFHLSNAYAKTGTTSRHELANLLRRTTPSR